MKYNYDINNNFNLKKMRMLEEELDPDEAIKAYLKAGPKDNGYRKFVKVVGSCDYFRSLTSFIEVYLINVVGEEPDIRKRERAWNGKFDYAGIYYFDDYEKFKEFYYFVEKKFWYTSGVWVEIGDTTEKTRNSGNTFRVDESLTDDPGEYFAMMYK